MKKLWIRIYSTYGLLIFAGALLLLYPLFLLSMLSPRFRRLALFLNKVWARIFLTLSFIPPRLVWKGQLKPGQQYLLVGNHTSYLDIVLMGYVPRLCVFVGKKSLTKVPVFGFMFRKIHITVDRSNARSRYHVFEEGEKVIDQGLSLVMFPEGGISSANPPRLAGFRNGAFKLAIVKKVPIVPVTMPHNWRIQPGDNKMIMHPERPLVVFHEPIETTGMTLADVDALRERVYNTIHLELIKHYPNLAEKDQHHEN